MSDGAGGSGMSATAVTSVTATTTVTEEPASTGSTTFTLTLRPQAPEPDRRVQWRNDTVDNEHMNKKKSKRMCWIYLCAILIIVLLCILCRSKTIGASFVFHMPCDHVCFIQTGFWQLDKEKSFIRCKVHMYANVLFTD